MKQTEKLASAMYLVKSAGMQEKLQDAVRYVKHIFNPPTDEQVWASRFNVKPEDLSKVNTTPSILSSLALGLGGLGAGAIGGSRVGGALGKTFLPNLLRKIHRSTMSPLQKKTFNIEDLVDDLRGGPAFKQYQEGGKELGALGGSIGGMLAGQSMGSYLGEQINKPGIIQRLREQGYPKN